MRSGLAILVLLILLVSSSFANPTIIAPQPNLDLWDNGGIFALREDSDGRLYVGGDFSLFMGEPRTNFARLLPNGELDPDFAPNVNGPILSITLAPDDSILIGGFFTRIDHAPRDRLARFNSDGLLDQDWTPSANELVLTMVLGDDSDLYIGGRFTEVNGMARNRIARISLEDGTVDPNWRVDANDIVWTLIMDDNSSLWFGGEFTQVDGQPAEYLGVVTSDLDVIAPFSLNSDVYALAQGSTGDIYVCGAFTEIQGQHRNSLARVNSTLNIDPGWLPDLSGIVYDCLATSSGLLAAGSFAEAGGAQVGGLARFSLQNGQTDLTFLPQFTGINSSIPGAESLIITVQELTDSTIATGGYFRFVNESPASSGAVLESTSGTPIVTFDAETAATIWEIAPLHDNSWLIGGTFRRHGSALNDNLLRLLPNGTPDLNWTVGTNGTVLSIETNGASVYVGGSFSRLGSIGRTSLGRLDLTADGPVINKEWAPSLAGLPTVLKLQKDRYRADSLYVAGNFDHAAPGSYVAQNLIRVSLHGTGNTDISLNNVAANGEINAISQDSGGTIFLGGTFSSISGLSRRGLAAFNNIDALIIQPSFNASLNSSVTSLLYDEVANSLFVAGRFTRAFGQNRQRAFSLQNTLMTNWSPNISDGVPLSMSINNAGQIYLSGTFQKVNGAEKPLLARVDAYGNGQLDNTFDPLVIGNFVRTSIPTPTSLWVGGNFFEAGGEERRAVARFIDMTEVDDQIFADAFESGEGLPRSATRQTLNFEESACYSRAHELYFRSLASPLNLTQCGED